MPIGHITNATAGGSARISKRSERPKTKERSKDGKDFAFFIPFFLAEKKAGKKERRSEKR